MEKKGKYFFLALSKFCSMKYKSSESETWKRGATLPPPKKTTFMKIEKKTSNPMADSGQLRRIYDTNDLLISTEQLHHRRCAASGRAFDELAPSRAPSSKRDICELLARSCCSNCRARTSPERLCSQESRRHGDFRLRLKIHSDRTTADMAKSNAALDRFQTITAK